MGDACHTHSSKLGQAMNVSMLDAFDLNWKLAHTIFGLTNDRSSLLKTYVSERRDNALTLNNSDKRWYDSCYGKKKLSGGARVFSEDEMLAELKNFVASDSVEYEAELADQRMTSDGADAMIRYNAGALTEAEVGRCRCEEIRKRQSDPSTRLDGIHGKYDVVVRTGKDLLENGGICQTVLRALINDLIPQLPPWLFKIFSMTSLGYMSFEWTQLPTSVKAFAEMRLYHTTTLIASSA